MHSRHVSNLSSIITHRFEGTLGWESSRITDALPATPIGERVKITAHTRNFEASMAWTQERSLQSVLTCDNTITENWFSPVPLGDPTCLWRSCWKYWTNARLRCGKTPWSDTLPHGVTLRSISSTWWKSTAINRPVTLQRRSGSWTLVNLYSLSMTWGRYTSIDEWNLANRVPTPSTSGTSGTLGLWGLLDDDELDGNESTGADDGFGLEGGGPGGGEGFGFADALALAPTEDDDAPLEDKPLDDFNNGLFLDGTTLKRAAFGTKRVTSGVAELKVLKTGTSSSTTPSATGDESTATSLGSSASESLGTQNLLVPSGLAKPPAWITGTVDLSRPCSSFHRRKASLFLFAARPPRIPLVPLVPKASRGSGSASPPLIYNAQCIQCSMLQIPQIKKLKKS